MKISTFLNIYVDVGSSFDHELNYTCYLGATYACHQLFNSGIKQMGELIESILLLRVINIKPGKMY